MSSISRGSLSALEATDMDVGQSTPGSPPGARGRPAVCRHLCYDTSVRGEGRFPQTIRQGPPLPGEILADLLPIVGEINQILDPDALLPAIAQRIRRIVDYRILDIFLPNAEGLLIPAHVEGYAPGLPADFQLRPGEGIVGTAAASREPLFVPNVATDPRYVHAIPGVVAEMAIP